MIPALSSWLWPRPVAAPRNNLDPFPCFRARKKIQQGLVHSGFDIRSPSFYPRDKLVACMDYDLIKEVLQCSCPTCSSDSEVLNSQNVIYDVQRYCEHILQSGDRRVDVARPNPSALFALLIFIEAPMFILPFLHREYHDDQVLGLFCSMDSKDSDIETIQNMFWADFRKHNPTRSRFVAESFLSEMYRFWPPVLSGNGFQSFPQGTIMPFCEEKKIGDGISSSVFAFRVHRGYLRIPDFAEDCFFARKELRPQTMPQAWSREVENLNRVDTLNDRHIVKIIKAYSKGEVFNIVFAKAECSLEQCLRGENNILDPLCLDVLSHARLWDQMLGLAHALDRIINFDTGPADQDRVRRYLPSVDAPQLLGYHFDIKPANILVFFDEDRQIVLKISDFGQALFRNFDTHQSWTIVRPGADTYMAPEAAVNSDGTINSRYDVWSLGCVFTELVTFLQQGAAGVEQFRTTRRFTGDHGTDFRFYDKTSDSGGARVRTAVDEWIRDLLPDNDLSPTEENVNAQFSSGIRELLFDMLKPDPEMRHTSRKVYQQLGKLLHEARHPHHVPTPILPSRDGSEEPSEFEWKGHKLSILSSIWSRKAYENSDNFLRSTLRLQHNFRPSTLKLHVHKSRFKLETLTNGILEVHSDRRSDVFLVPAFAWRRFDQQHSRSSSPDFWIVSKPAGSRGEIHPFCRTEDILGSFLYQFTSLGDAHILQSLLSGHDVFKTWYVKDFTYVPEFRLMRSVGNALHRARRNSSQSSLLSDSAQATASSVQLWKEMKQASHPPEQSAYHSGSQRAPRDPGNRVKPTPCRIVIFCSESIITIHFAEHFRMKKASDQDATAIVHFEITEKAKHIQRSILGARLHSPAWGSEQEKIPILPLDPLELRKSELDEANRLEMKSFDLAFPTTEAAIDFRNVYESLKRSWLDEHMVNGIG